MRNLFLNNFLSLSKKFLSHKSSEFLLLIFLLLMAPTKAEGILCLLTFFEKSIDLFTFIFFFPGKADLALFFIPFFILINLFYFLKLLLLKLKIFYKYLL